MNELARDLSDEDCLYLHVLCRWYAKQPGATQKMIVKTTIDKIKLQEKVDAHQTQTLALRDDKIYDIKRGIITRLFNRWRNSHYETMREYSHKLVLAISELLENRRGAVSAEYVSAFNVFVGNADWRSTAEAQLLIDARFRHAHKDVQSAFTTITRILDGAENERPAAKKKLQVALSLIGVDRDGQSFADVSLRPAGLLQDARSGMDGEESGARYVLVRLHTREPDFYLCHGLRFADHNWATSMKEPNLTYFSETYVYKEVGQRIERRSYGTCFMDGSYLTAIARPNDSHYLTYFVAEISERGSSKFEHFPALITSRNGFKAQYSAFGLCLRCANKADEESKTGGFTKRQLQRRFDSTQWKLIQEWAPKFWARELIGDQVTINAWKP